MLLSLSGEAMRLMVVRTVTFRFIVGHPRQASQALEICGPGFWALPERADDSTEAIPVSD